MVVRQRQKKRRGARGGSFLPAPSSGSVSVAALRCFVLIPRQIAENVVRHGEDGGMTVLDGGNAGGGGGG